MGSLSMPESIIGKLVGRPEQEPRFGPINREKRTEYYTLCVYTAFLANNTTNPHYNGEGK